MSTMTAAPERGGRERATPVEQQKTFAPRVPGAGAPSSDVLKIWNSMGRWILKSHTPFAKFLQSMHGLPLPAEGSTAPTVWPMPIPFPECWSGEEADFAELSFSKWALRKVLNLVTSALSWLHMGRPKIAPRQMAMHRPLSAQQWKVVRRFERLMVEVQHTRTVTFREMGRSAAKVESLDNTLCQLHEAAAALCTDGYDQVRRHVKLSSSFSLLGHELGEPGEVVGHMPQSASIIAKKVEVSRLSFPAGRPEFDPTTLFSEPHSTVYRDPISLAMLASEAEEPPKVRVHGSFDEAMALFKFLDHHQRLRLAPATQVRKSHLCGAFALVKDSLKDRLIVDARPPNSLEQTLRTYTQTLGAVSALLQIELEPANRLMLHGTDLRDYYYCFQVTKQRAYRSAFRFPLSFAQASEFNCFDPTLAGDEFYPCLSTMAMGDNNAVELGQGAHVLLGMQSGLIAAEELLTIHSRAPRGRLACGIVIDDILFAEKVPRCLDPAEPTEGKRRLLSMCEEYLQRGLTAHPQKTFSGSDHAEIWGASVDGLSGTVRSSCKKLIPLIALTVRTAQTQHATVELLEILAGSWVAILQCRKRMMCLLDEIYVAQQGRPATAVVRLSPPLIDELWLLAILSPLAVTDLRAGSLEHVFLSDASEEFKAAVNCKIGKVFSKELQRHSLTRGAWSRLLSPWKVWCRNHAQLFAEEELPDGVPLVSHPLWLMVAQTLQYQLFQRRLVRRKRHINLLELESILEVEEKLSTRHSDVRYLLGSDSQVALAAVLKGRSSSPHLNRLLQRSLATLLGGGLYGNYGFIPSLANVSDDPTRRQAIRAPEEQMPEWLRAALEGEFSGLDRWLAAQGYDPLRVAGLEFLQEQPMEVQAVVEHVEKLERVQKPERMKKFLEKSVASVQSSSAVKGRLDEDSLRVQDLSFSRTACDSGVCTGSLAVNLEDINKKEPKREQQESIKSHQDLSEAPPTSGGKEKANQDCRVAPPEVGHGVAPPQGAKVVGGSSNTSSPELPPSVVSSRAAMAENVRSPLLTAEQQKMLQRVPGQFFLLPGGKRASTDFDPSLLRRRGVLDLYSGAAGTAKAISRRFHVWVLTVDFSHGADQDLLDPELQQLLLELAAQDLFLGLGAAPECCSFSRAVTPAVRSAASPEGLPNLTKNMAEKVAKGNKHAEFLFRLLQLFVNKDLAYWLENPDGSFLWLLPAWLQSGLCDHSKAFRFDQCRYSTPWRKRTRVLTNTCLQNVRALCLGGHSHLQLRGQSAAHRVCWTRVAQTYPLALCSDLASAMGMRMGLCSKQLKLNITSCAKCNERIGEASHPGPQRAAQRQPRSLADLETVQLVSGQTLRLQERVWNRFQTWVGGQVSPDAAAQLFLCPQVATAVLSNYGKFLFLEGAPLYEFRHLLVLVQQNFAIMRQHLGPAWRVLTQWEEVQPLKHRRPLPELLFKAMFSIAMCWRWKRFAATLLLAVEGIARIGEVLQATREDLVLPSDVFDNSRPVAFVRVKKPKTFRRGKGRVQHLKISNEQVIRVLERIFGPLDFSLRLFPHSASAFRRRWEKILDTLGVPRTLRPTPAGVRGGGAILAYKRGEAIQDIMWRMRLVSQATLESYLQELAAESLLAKLPEHCRSKIRSAASFYSLCLQSPG